MQNAREYAERIYKLSKKVYWEVVKVRQKITESYNQMIDAKQALQEALKKSWTRSVKNFASFLFVRIFFSLFFGMYVYG